jgi:hypothetical protein
MQFYEENSAKIVEGLGRFALSAKQLTSERGGESSILTISQHINNTDKYGIFRANVRVSGKGFDIEVHATLVDNWSPKTNNASVSVYFQPHTPKSEVYEVFRYASEEDGDFSIENLLDALMSRFIDFFFLPAKSNFPTKPIS